MKSPQVNRLSRRKKGLVLLIVGSLFTILGIVQLLFGTHSLLGGPGHAPLPFGIIFMVLGVIFLARPKV